MTYATNPIASIPRTAAELLRWETTARKEKLASGKQ
jgi:hypothetical protein